MRRVTSGLMSYSLGSALISSLSFQMSAQNTSKVEGDSLSLGSQALDTAAKTLQVGNTDLSNSDFL
jgi:hypothetical protein